jgi:hypothetical protein
MSLCCIPKEGVSWMLPREWEQDRTWATTDCDRLLTPTKQLVCKTVKFIGSIVSQFEEEDSGGRQSDPGGVSKLLAARRLVLECLSRLDTWRVDMTKFMESWGLIAVQSPLTPELRAPCDHIPAWLLVTRWTLMRAQIRLHVCSE